MRHGLADRAEHHRLQNLHWLQIFLARRASGEVLTLSVGYHQVTLVTFAVYVLTDPTHVLTPQKAFVSLALFELLRFPIIMIPIMISSLVEARVSLGRLEEFLCHDELDRASVERRPRGGGGEEPAVRVSRASFGWNRKDEFVALKKLVFASSACNFSWCRLLSI